MAYNYFKENNYFIFLGFKMFIKERNYFIKTFLNFINQFYLNFMILIIFN